MKKRLYSNPTCEVIDLALQQVLCESLEGNFGDPGLVITGDIDED